MKKWRKYIKIAMYTIYITFISLIISKFYDNLVNLILFLSLFLIGIVNDNLRYKGKLNSNIKYYVSITISIIIGGLLKYFVDGYMDVYLFIIMSDIAWIKNKKAVIILYILNLFTMIFVDFYRISITRGISFMDIITKDFVDIMFLILMIFSFSVSIFSYVALIKERNKVLKLNKEIEELTITKERSRIAQDIHDNLGHCLVALNMNLDVAKNFIDNDKDKTKEILSKCQNLTKESINSLRKAVYALNEDSLSKGLKHSIEEIICNINETSNMNIAYKDNGNVEDLPFEYKSILYTTIKESLTNSIKHSKCSKINIDLDVKDEIHLNIKDNGIGCNNFIKGNGLKGLEERIKNVNGYIEYKYKEGEGFEILLTLPLLS